MRLSDVATPEVLLWRLFFCGGCHGRFSEVSRLARVSWAGSFFASP